MNKTDSTISDQTIFDSANYDIDSLESEICAERHASELLKRFHGWLLSEKNCEPLEAGTLAGGADYFLRQFAIGAKRMNLFQITAVELRQFGGNWYIVNNLEPNLAELMPLLKGASMFYTYCLAGELVEVSRVAEIQKAAEDSAYFAQRIEDFLCIEGDGYQAWNQACPLT